MGLGNSPATFLHYMEYVFTDNIFVTMFVYLDDLLIFFRDEEEQSDRLQMMFEVLRKYGLKLKPSKCHLKSQIKYFRYVVSRKQVSADPERIKAVQEWPNSRTVREMSAFVAFC